MASAPVFALLLSIFSVGAVLLGYGAVALVNVLRLHRDAGRPPGSGLLTLDGTAVERDAFGTVSSPVTGRTALWYEYAIQQRGDDKSRADWETVARGTDGGPFGLETAEGTVIVDPDGASVDVDPDLEVEFEATPEEVAALGQVADAAATDGDSIVVGDVTLDAGEPYRLVERRIGAGDQVLVSGSATVDRAAGDGDEAQPRVSARPDRGVLWRRLAVPLVIADPDGSGARGYLRDRAIAGLVFGLPLAMLALAYGSAQGA